MRTTFVFLAACAIAALSPFLGKPARPNPAAAAFPGWPAYLDSRPLTPLPLTEGELRFERDFAGRIARFSDGRREIALRWVAEATRSLHPAEDCLKAAGYDVRPLPAYVDAEGKRWGSLMATRGGRTMRVRERIHDGAGHGWTDVSAWYWDALGGHSRGPWWAVTIAECESNALR
jgi:hypothetical protein